MLGGDHMTIKPITEIAKPIIEAISKSLDKDECYTFLAGFAVTISYFIYATASGYSFLASLNTWKLIIGLLGLWIVITGSLYGIVHLTTSALMRYANTRKKLKEIINDNNAFVIQKVQHYSIA
ncbi:MAG: hypothetical protein ABH826_03470, partial [Patescibacteria group bacterium]